MIRTIIDAAGNTASMVLGNPGASGSIAYTKAIVIDTSAPAVQSVSSSKANGTYKAGETITVTVQFSESVTVTNTPQITLETGATDQVVDFTTGSGTDQLSFVYTVGAGDTSADLDYVASSLVINDGTIKDSVGNSAVLTLAAPAAADSLGANKDIVIDTTAPTVTLVTSSTGDGSFNYNDSISIQVQFSEVVNVTGVPKLKLETGTTDQDVDYSSGDTSDTFTFNYVVQTGDTSADLAYFSATALTVISAAIKDGAGNDAVLTLATPGAADSLSNAKALIVDTTAPTVLNVSSSTANGSYKTGDTIDVEVQFSEDVIVSGTEITLETGATDAVVTYSSGSTTDTITYTYTIAAGATAADLDYKSATIAMNGGSITDTALNSANVTLADPGDANSLGANKALVVDTTAPTVNSVTTAKADGSYKAGESIDITVEFSETVTVTNTPQITMETGTTDQAVDYTSGDGSNTLTFNYVVQAGDTSADLDYLSTSALALNGGTIVDGAGNSAALTLVAAGAADSISDDKAIIIDTTKPTISSISDAEGDPTNTASFTVNITFSENVTLFAVEDIIVVNGSKSSFAGSNSSYSFTITPSDGVVNVNINADSLTDTAGNGNTAASQYSFTFDSTVPVSGNSGTLTPVNVELTSLTLNWTKATDTPNSPTAIEYLAYYSDSDNISSIASLEANGTAIGSYTADIDTIDVSGLIANKTYWFNVIAKDLAANKTEYTSYSVVTASTPTESLVTVDDIYEASDSKVVFNGTHFGVIYRDKQDGDENIFFQMFDTNGTAASSKIHLTPDDTFDAEEEPDLVWNATNNEFAALYCDSKGTGDPDQNAYFQRIDANGAKVGSEIMLSPEDTFYAKDPKIVAAGSQYGALYNSDDKGDVNFFLKILDNDGAVDHMVENMSLDDVYDAKNPRLIYNSDNTEFAIVYADDRYGDMNIFMHRIEIDGTNHGSTTVTTDDAYSSGWGGQIAWDGSNYGIAYTENENAYFVKVTPAGTVGTAQLLSIDDAYTPSFTEAAIATAGSGWAVCYVDLRTASQPDIFIHRIGSNGVKIAETRITTDDSSDDANDCRISWTGSDYAVAYRDKKDTGDKNIWVATMNTAGVATTPVRISPDDSYDGSRPEFAYDNTTKVFGVMYYDVRVNVKKDFYFSASPGN